MSAAFMKKSLIYCRVSSKRQATEGHGLDSQEFACRRHAQMRGYDVEKVFKDDFTGGGDFWNRPAMASLLRFLDQHSDENFVVIFDDLKRFARDTVFHLKLRQELRTRNATPECLNFSFEDTPEGEFVETILAAQAQLERKQNSRQVVSRMKARLKAGYWVFCPPIGYKFEKRKDEKRLVPDVPVSISVKEALEGFAGGELATQRDVEKFLSAHGCVSKWSDGKSLVLQRIARFLSNPAYAGWCVSQKWDVRVKGHHEPLISEQTHRRILERLSSRSRSFTRQDARADFPLRGFIQCARCGRMITSCWSQGRNEKYPYYRCQSKECIGSIPRKVMDEEFAERLEEATPRNGCLQIFEEILREAFADRGQVQAALRKRSETEKLQVSKEIDGLVDSIARSSNPDVQGVYEEKLARLVAKRKQLEEDSQHTPYAAIEPVLEAGRDMLKNPARYWLEENLRKQRMLQEIVFDGLILYNRESGYRTAELSLFYELFRRSEGRKGHLVDLLRANLNPVAREFERWGKALNLLKFFDS